MFKKILNFIIKYSIYGLVLLMPLLWLPWTFEGYEFNKLYLLFYFTLIAFIAWLAKMVIIQRRLLFQRTLLDLLLLIFIAATVVSAALSLDWVSSWFGFYGRFSNSVIGVLALVLLYFVAVNNISFAKPNRNKSGKLDGTELSKKNTKLAIKWRTLVKIFMVSGFVSVLATYFSIFGFWLNFENLPGAMTINSFNPVSSSLEGMAFFSVLIILLSLLVILFPKKENLAKKNKNRQLLAIIFSAVLLIAGILLLIIVNSLMVWLILAIEMFLLTVIFIWQRIMRDKINYLILPIIILSIAVGGYFGIFKNGYSWFGVETELSKEVMLDYSTAKTIALSVVKKYPALGTGPATFSADFLKYKPLEFNDNNFWNIQFDRAPSHWLEMLVTSGVIGFVFYLLIIILVLLTVAYIFIKNKKQELGFSGKRKLFIFISVFLVWLALILSQIVYYQNMVLGFFFWLALALIMVGFRDLRSRLAKKASFSFKNRPEITLLMNVGLLVICFVIIGLFYLAGRFFIADTKFLKAINIPQTNQDDLNNSIKYLEEAVSLNKYRVNYRIILSGLYLNKVWLEARKSDTERDLDALQRYVNGSFEQARLASQISPNLVSVWENWGTIYRDSVGVVGGTIPFSIDAFNKAVELEQYNPFFYRELCRLNILNQEKDWDRVIGLCQKAVDLKPNFLDAHLQLAMAYEQKGDLEQARLRLEATLDKLKGVNFERGSALAGAASEIYFQLGRVYYNLNNINQANKMFEQSVVIVPEYANARYGLALSYQGLGRLEDALVQFELVDQLVPDNEQIKQSIADLKNQIQ